MAYLLAQNSREYNKEGASTFAKKHKLGVVNRWGSMFNRWNGNPNISKLLSLGINIVQI